MCLLEVSTFQPHFNPSQPLRSDLGEGVLRGQKHKNCLFFGQSMKNLKLYNIPKNQLPRSIRVGYIGVSPIFELKKVLFLP